MRIGDRFLESIGIEREDKNKPIVQDIRDSVGTGLLNIDNIINEVETKIEHIEELEADAKDALGEVDEKLDEVDDKLTEIDIRIGIVEVKIAGAVILGLLALSDYYYQSERFLMAYISLTLAVVFALETVITLYRGFFGDFLVDGIVKVKQKVLS